MEDKLITDGDLREAIYFAEKESDYFEDETGLRTACLQKPVIVYWVDYREKDGRFAVSDAYCHRMHFGEESK